MKGCSVLCHNCNFFKSLNLWNKNPGSRNLGKASQCDSELAYHCSHTVVAIVAVVKGVPLLPLQKWVGSKREKHCKYTDRHEEFCNVEWLREKEQWSGSNSVVLSFQWLMQRGLSDGERIAQPSPLHDTHPSTIVTGAHQSNGQQRQQDWFELCTHHNKRSWRIYVCAYVRVCVRACVCVHACVCVSWQRHPWFGLLSLCPIIKGHRWEQHCWSWLLMLPFQLREGTSKTAA